MGDGNSNEEGASGLEENLEDRRFRDRRSRTPRRQFERDRDRVLYSDAFRRLSGVTQVARAGETSQYHNRLTHSLKVAQVGRRIAQYLNRHEQEERNRKERAVEPGVVATASLAHDLGHPPFGHAAESELNYQICRHGVDDGFEGNPQSFRIVNKVETNALYHDHPSDQGKGLNLTKRSLNALIKYPWEKGEYVPDADYDTEKKFGYYASEREIFEWVRDGYDSYKKSPEATLMDWADDVTYAVHDLIDFYRAGLIPLGEIFQDTAERDEFINHFNDKKGDDVADKFDPTTFLEDLLKYEGLDEKNLKRGFEANRTTIALVDLLQSTLIENYLSIPETVAFIPEEKSDSDFPEVQINPVKESEVEFLKELTFHYVIQNTALMSQQHGQRRIIATIFDAFLAATDDGYDSEYGKYKKYEVKMIPQPFRGDLLEANNREQRARLIGDAITSMTESQIVRLFERITGRQAGSIKEEII